jgi:dTDP-4-amino-4,6-dideoxygalactose transaminase
MKETTIPHIPRVKESGKERCMRIPILDLKSQYQAIKREINAAIKKVVEDQDFVLGSELSELEKEVAQYCSTKCAAGVASGTDALILSLWALGVKEGDEVITSPFTFMSTAEAASILGAIPVFVDIDPRTYTIDPSLIEAKITKRTKAIMPVHLYGQCADMDPIVDIAKRHGLKIVEDCAQAIGATYKGRKAGSMGDLGAISFFPSKNLGAYGEGGMVLTNDEALATKVKMLRVHGSSKRYMHSMIGTNSRLDNLQAAVVRVKLRYLDKWLEARRKHAEYYHAHLKGLPLTLPYTPAYNVHTYHLYVLRVRRDLEKMMRHLTEGGVETRTYYPVPLHLQECYRSLGYRKGDLTESEAAAAETFAVAVYPELKRRELDYVVRRIKNFFQS